MVVKISLVFGLLSVELWLEAAAFFVGKGDVLVPLVLPKISCRSFLRFSSRSRRIFRLLLTAWISSQASDISAPRTLFLMPKEFRQTINREKQNYVALV